MRLKLKEKFYQYLFYIKAGKELRLDLTDSEAYTLIKILKHFMQKHEISLDPGNKKNLQLNSEDGDNFILTYYTSKYRNDKISINLREKETNLSLVRINVDENSFHKNSNNEIIRGHRLLILSNQEWFAKNDGATYSKAFNIPKDFSDLKDIETVFLDFLTYINVKVEGKLTLTYNFP